MGNSTINSKEGSTYLGVGFIHLTGKETYQKVYDKWKLSNPNHETIKTIADFINALKTNVDVAIEASMIYWSTPNAKNENGNTLADQGNIDDVTKFVNGGTTGGEERETYTSNAMKVIK